MIPTHWRATADTQCSAVGHAGAWNEPRRRGRHRERHGRMDGGPPRGPRCSEAARSPGKRSAPGALAVGPRVRPAALPGLQGYSPSAAATNGGSFSAAWWMSAREYFVANPWARASTARKWKSPDFLASVQLHQPGG